MNVYERQARALESIARELKGIGKTLGQIKEIFSPEVLLIDESLQKHMTVKKESPGTCYMTEEPCDKCETWNGDGCEYLVRPGEPWPERSRYKLEHVVIDDDPFSAPWPKVNPHIGTENAPLTLSDAIKIAAAKRVADSLQRRNERTEGGGNG